LLIFVDFFIVLLDRLFQVLSEAFQVSGMFVNNSVDSGAKREQMSQGEQIGQDY